MSQLNYWWPTYQTQTRNTRDTARAKWRVGKIPHVLQKAFYISINKSRQPKIKHLGNFDLWRGSHSLSKITNMRTQYVGSLTTVWVISYRFLWCWFSENGYVRADSRFASSKWETSLQSNTVSHWLGANLILGLHPANERRRYIVTPSLIGWGKPRISPDQCQYHSRDLTSSPTLQTL